MLVIVSEVGTGVMWVNNVCLKRWDGLSVWKSDQ